jgi:hypothetical protein
MFFFGSVHLSVFTSLLWQSTNRFSRPVPHVLWCAILQTAGKVAVKAFGSVLGVLHSPLNQAFLQRGMDVWCVTFKSPQACGHRVPPPSAETGCFPQILINPETGRPAASVFPSLETDSAGILLSFGLTATTHSHTDSEPALVKDS